MNPKIDLSDITDSEDPRIAEGADQVIAGLRLLVDELGPDVAAAILDAIAERLDVLCEEVAEQIEEDANESDESLLADDE